MTAKNLCPISVILSLPFVMVACLAPVPGPGCRVDKLVLQEAFPQLRNARVLTLEDIHDPLQRQLFLSDPYSFVLEGDFDKDGSVDCVVAGIAANRDGDEAAFVAIITMRDGRPAVEFLRTFHSRILVLSREPAFYKGYDAIVISFTIGTDLEVGLVWDGRKYVVFRDKSELPK